MAHERVGLLWIWSVLKLVAALAFKLYDLDPKWPFSPRKPPAVWKKSELAKTKQQQKKKNPSTYPSVWEL